MTHLMKAVDLHVAEDVLNNKQTTVKFLCIYLYMGNFGH